MVKHSKNLFVMWCFYNQSTWFNSYILFPACRHQNSFCLITKFYVPVIDMYCLADLDFIFWCSFYLGFQFVYYPVSLLTIIFNILSIATELVKDLKGEKHIFWSIRPKTFIAIYLRLISYSTIRQVVWLHGESWDWQLLALVPFGRWPTLWWHTG